MVGIDLIVVGVIVFFALKGYKKGLVYTVLNFVSLLLSAVVTKLFSGLFVDKILNGMFNLESTLEKLIGDKATETLTSKTQFASLINVQGEVQSLAENVTNLVGVAVLFIVSTIVLKIVVNLLSKIVSIIPVVSQLNTIGGLAIGVAEGFIIVWFLMIVMDIFSATDLVINMKSSIDSSTFSKCIYENNLLSNWIMK